MTEQTQTTAPQPGLTWRTPYGDALERHVLRTGFDGWGTPYVWYRRGDEAMRERACGLKAWRKWVRKMSAEAVICR
jgi:hypothetical protein